MMMAQPSGVIGFAIGNNGPAREVESVNRTFINSLVVARCLLLAESSQWQRQLASLKKPARMQAYVYSGLARMMTVAARVSQIADSISALARYYCCSRPSSNRCCCCCCHRRRRCRQCSIAIPTGGVSLD